MGNAKVQKSVMSIHAGYCLALQWSQNGVTSPVFLPHATQMVRPMTLPNAHENLAQVEHVTIYPIDLAFANAPHRLASEVRCSFFALESR